MAHRVKPGISRLPGPGVNDYGSGARGPQHSSSGACRSYPVRGLETSLYKPSRVGPSLSEHIGDPLLVRPATREAHASCSPASELIYEFGSGSINEPTSARVLEGLEPPLRLEIPAASRMLDGGFRSHALNRVFANQLMRSPPSCVILQGLAGCVLDLARIARILGVPVALLLETPDDYRALSAESDWIKNCLGALDLLVAQEAVADRLRALSPAVCPTDDFKSPEQIVDAARSRRQTKGHFEACAFDYSLYEFLQRDPPLLMRMQEPLAQLFDGCSRVLDLGCGAGLFLSLLAERGIAAKGVERNPVIARYGREMGLDIETSDAIDFLESASGYDGVYCSHFVEHLPFDSVDKLIASIAAALEPGGRAVFAFPDPESIRSQLLGFWRDPEHVRFYHPELIETVALAHGLSLVWSSYDEQPHEVVPFPLTAPAVPSLAAVPPSAGPGPATHGGLWSRARRLLGLPSAAEVTQLRDQVAALQSVVATQTAALRGLVDRTDTLWAVNRTWAWEDNAVLMFRKQP